MPRRNVLATDNPTLLNLQFLIVEVHKLLGKDHKREFNHKKFVAETPEGLNYRKTATFLLLMIGEEV